MSIGGIRAKGPNTWELRIGYGKDPVTGKYRRTSKLFHGTERQALRELKRQSQELYASDLPATELTVGQLLDIHLDQLVLEGKSPATLNGYTWRVRDVIKPALGPKRLADLSVADLDRLYQAEIERGVAASTVRQHHTVISGALTRAAKKGWLGERPVNVAQYATLPGTTKTPVAAPCPDDIAEVWRAAAEKDPERAMFLRISINGPRRGEVCGLRWTDLDDGELLIARNVVAVKAGTAGAEATSGQHARRRGGHRLVMVKSLKSDRPRRIALDRDTALALALHRGRMEARAEECGLSLVPDAYIFSDDPDGARPWHPDTMSSFVYRLRRSLGIDYERLLHGLRHHGVTELLANGIDPEVIAERFGHSPSMVLEVYGHARRARDQDAADLLGRILR